MNITIRETTNADRKMIYDVEVAAFNEEDEAVLVEELLDDSTAKPAVSLLALDKDRPVGHILFTPARIVETDQLAVMILAPLAVIPEYQKQGIGGQLIKRGLSMLKEQGMDLVFVLGHISYYPRHGFVPALAYGYLPPFPTKKGFEDAWMVTSLTETDLSAYQGQVIGSETLMKPENW